MRYYKKLVGDKIYLSPIRMEDAPKYTEWLADMATAERIGNACNLMSEDSERQWVVDQTTGGAYQFGIIRREDDVLMGNCGIFDISGVHRFATVGLFIGEASNRGKGYGAEALRLMLMYAFDYLNLNSVMLTVYDFNENAIACYKKVGFRECGRRRQAYFSGGSYHDRVEMDILRDEWNALNAK